MGTLTARLKRFESESIGSIITLKRTVRGMKYGVSEINNAFRKFVDKNEYAQDERDMILEDLYSASKGGEIVL